MCHIFFGNNSLCGNVATSLFNRTCDLVSEKHLGLFVFKVICQLISSYMVSGQFSSFSGFNVVADGEQECRCGSARTAGD